MFSNLGQSAVRKVKKFGDKVDNMAHNYPEFPAFPLVGENLPFQIGKNVSVKEYNTFLDRKEKSGYKFRWEDKNVYIVDMSDPVHDGVVSLLMRYFNVPNGPVIIDPPVFVLGDPYHYDPSDNTYSLKMAADITIQPNETHVTNPSSRHPGPPPSDVEQNPYGRIFCEVAYHESHNYLETKCKNWMTKPYVRYVLGIKIYGKRKGSNDRSMTAKLYSRVGPLPTAAPPTAAPSTAPTTAPPAPPVPTAVTGHPGLFVQEWDFGTKRLGSNTNTGCTGPGINSHLVTIPVSEVFWDPPIGAGAAGYTATIPTTVTVTTPNFVIDLYHIQREVMRRSL